MQKPQRTSQRAAASRSCANSATLFRHIWCRNWRGNWREETSSHLPPWSHVVSLIYAQLTHSLGLNDVCDALRLHSGPLSAIRGATPPSKNALSTPTGNATPKWPRRCSGRCSTISSNFIPVLAGAPAALAFRFKRLIHVVDSTTIQLVAHCLDWAKHRRRKAAAKCHVRLDLQTFLPRFALVDTAGEHESLRAREVCAGVRAGEIVIFDKAYVDFAHLADLSARDVFWVTRAKENLRSRVVRKFQHGVAGNLLRDDLIALTNPPVKKVYPVELRRVVALVEVDGRTPGDGLPDQQSGMERPDHR